MLTKVSSQTSVMRRYFFLSFFFFFPNFEPWSNWERRIYFTILKISKLLTIYYFIRPAILYSGALYNYLRTNAMTQIAKEPQPRYRKPSRSISPKTISRSLNSPNEREKKVSFSVYREIQPTTLFSLSLCPPTPSNFSKNLFRVQLSFLP